jgi:hypothetical protein
MRLLNTTTKKKVKPPKEQGLSSFEEKQKSTNNNHCVFCNATYLENLFFSPLTLTWNPDPIDL